MDGNRSEHRAPLQLPEFRLLDIGPLELQDRLRRFQHDHSLRGGIGRLTVGKEDDGARFKPHVVAIDVFVGLKDKLRAIAFDLLWVIKFP